MALIHRDGRAYLYRSVRRDGRVTSEYVGSGETARLIALLDATDREEREADRHAGRAERERDDAEDRDIAQWSDRVEALAHAALEAAGYHRHNRQWRKRRARRTDDPTPTAAARRPDDEGNHQEGRLGG